MPLLEQIERKHRQMQEDIKQAQDLQVPEKGKTVGVKLSPQTYARLVKVKEQLGLKSIKSAMLYVAEKGIERVLEPRG
jgi:hypothetical protein